MGVQRIIIRGGIIVLVKAVLLIDEHGQNPKLPASREPNPGKVCSFHKTPPWGLDERGLLRYN